VVLEAESREGFDTLLAGFVERFNPADSVEFGFIEEMLSALWRQRRAWAIETKLMDDAIAAGHSESGGQRAQIASAFAELAAQPQLGLLHRYESRLHRVFQRAFHNLVLLRAEDQVQPGPPSEPGAAPAQLSECQTNLVPESDTLSGSPEVSLHDKIPNPV
jgi:hypothetical protein